MAYKPQVKKSQFKRGPAGVAQVEISPDKKKVRITFEEQGDKYILSKKDCPDYVRKGNWFVTLSDDKSKILNFRPANGVFIAKVKKFTANENQPPAPRTKVLQDYSYQFFVVILELLNPEVKGMEIPAVLRYHFDEEEEDGKSVVAFSHPKSKYTPQLVEFCEVTGVWNKGALPYKDNILPLLEKRITVANKQFQVIIKAGYPDSFIETDKTIKEEEEVKEDEEFVPDEEELEDED